MRISNLVAVALLGTTLFAVSSLSIKVTPRVGTVPHTVAVKVIVEPDPDNRILWLYWGKSDEDTSMMSKSRVDLDGASAPRTTFYTPKVLREPGEWTFIAVVEKATGKVQRSVETVEVTGGF